MWIQPIVHRTDLPDVVMAPGNWISGFCPLFFFALGIIFTWSMKVRNLVMFNYGPPLVVYDHMNLVDISRLNKILSDFPYQWLH